MKITILGSGTFMPDLKRKNSSYLLEEGKEKIILDFGRGTIDRLLQLKINLARLDKIFISHMHTDHCSELINFLFILKHYPNKKDLRKRYTIYGPKGIKKSLNMILKGFGISKEKTLKRVKIKEIPDMKEIRIGKLKIKAFEVDHIKPKRSLSYRVTSKKKVFCYSGDSNYCLGLKKASVNADLAIIESTLPRSSCVKGHLCGEDLGKLAEEAKIKKLIVTHVANFYLSEVKKEIKENYGGPIIIAKDLMKFKI